MVDVGNEIKKRREALHISQNQLAKRSGCAQSTLSAIENTTKKPSTETLRGIASALGCTVAELMGENGDQGDGSGTRLTAKEQEIVRIYRQLNPMGQAELISRAQEMASLSKWTQEAAALG